MYNCLGGGGGGGGGDRTSKLGVPVHLCVIFGFGEPQQQSGKQRTSKLGRPRTEPCFPHPDVNTVITVVPGPAVLWFVDSCRIIEQSFHR